MTIRRFSIAWLSVAALSLTAATCPPPAPQPSTPQPPGSITFDVVPDAGQGALQGADVNVDGIHQRCCPGGVTTWVKPPGQPTVDVTVTLAGYQTAHAVVDFHSGPNPHVIPMALASPFPPENGRLHTSGKYFLTDSNQAWRWRGASMFMLPARFFAGEDIRPDLDWCVSRGINVIRTFWTANFADSLYLHWERPWERPGFDRTAGAFFDLAAASGVRVEATVLTYGFDQGEERTYVQRIYDLAAPRWNVFVEVANEAENNGIDPIAAMQGVNRRGVLSNYGLDSARAYQASGSGIIPVLDYGSTHDLDRDFEHSARSTKDLTDMQGAMGVPFVADEPVGVIDLPYPGYHQTGVDQMGQVWAGHDGGGGARTQNLTLIKGAAGIAYILGAGYTLHIQSGLDGHAPALGSIQDQAAEALANIALFIPADASHGAYSRAGNDTFALAWRMEPYAIESRVGHGYCSIMSPALSWCVVPVPAPTWQGLIGVNGWRLGAVGPQPFVARLER